MKTVTIDCFPESAARYRNYAVVAVDVVRATTTAISAVATGRRVFVAPTIDAARELTTELGNAFLVGEQKGIMPPGFELNNSPVELLERTDLERPVVLLSSSGTKLCYEASLCDAAFLACFRNYISVAVHLAESFPKVAVIGAGSRGEFRPEDQMCCAWIAESLVQLGYVPVGDETSEIIRRWSGMPLEAWTASKSVAYLRESGQLADLKFILDHTADLTTAFTMRGSEVIMGNSVAREVYLELTA
jgi:2-phosphosulfolactate phosphatase